MKILNIKYIHFAISAFICLSFVNCSSSSGTSSITPDITTIDQLPSATSPVVDDSLALSVRGLTSNGSLLSYATDGMSYDHFNQESFNSESSVAACETFNSTKEIIRQASQGDLVQCYIVKIFVAAMQSGLTNDAGELLDIYDGRPHVYDLDFTGTSLESENSEAQVDHVKFAIEQGPTGQISDLKVYSCAAGVQKDYVHKNINGNEFSLLNKSIRSQDGETQSGQTEVTGILNEQGQFVDSKNVTLSYVLDAENSLDHFSVSRFSQYSDSADLTSYSSGSFLGPDDSEVTGTYVNSLVGKMQLIDQNDPQTRRYDIRNLSLGDGAVSVYFSGSYLDMSWNDQILEGWNGDTTARDDSAAEDYLNAVFDATLPEESLPTIVLQDGEIYDCNEPAEVTIRVADLNVNLGSCSNYNLNHEWINCWDIVESEPVNENTDTGIDVSGYPALADIADNMSDTFIVRNEDYDKIARATPYYGRSLPCNHTGAHIHFEDTGETYTVDLIAPFDGVVTRVDTCVDAGANDRYGVSLAFAQDDGEAVSFVYAIEPMDGHHCTPRVDDPSTADVDESSNQDGRDPNYYVDYIDVEVGDTITKGQTVARMLKLPGGQSAAHVDFHLIRDNSTGLYCPNIFDENITEDFGEMYDGLDDPDNEIKCTYSDTEFVPVTFCHSPDEDQDIVNN